MEDLAKQLRIKIGALKRIQKEYGGYQKEEEKQREKIKTLELLNGDEYTIKKQKEVLEETVAMLPNVKTRLTDALNDMKQFLDENGENTVISGMEEKMIAIDLVASTQEFLNQINSL